MPGQYTDKEIGCVDCGTTFTFAASEQERFVQLGFTNEPKRCHPCRVVKKRARGDTGPGGGGAGGGRPEGGPKEYHKAACAECGGEAIVPFKPRGDRPVYCSACFDKRR